MATERKGREWVIRADEFDSDADFRVAVEQELVDIFPMANRGGRGVIVAPLRVQDGDGYYTAGFAFEEVFMPAVRAREPEVPEPHPITDEELERDALEHAREQEPVEA